MRQLRTPVEVTVADGRRLTITTVGALSLTVFVAHRGVKSARVISISNVYHVPTLAVTLLSVSQLVHSGHIVRFENNQWSVSRHPAKESFLQASEVNGVYEVVTPESAGAITDVEPGAAWLATLRRRVSLATWHRRLGHLNYGDCKRLAQSHAVNGIVMSSAVDPPACKSCALAKVTTAPAPVRRSSTDELADAVCHMDLSGPVHTSYHGNEYFLIVVWRGYIKVYGLRHKSDAGQKATEFFRFIERQAEVPSSSIKTVRTDGGTEFVGEDFRKLVSDQGVRHQHTTRYRSSQNGVAERAIRTVTEAAAAMLIDSHLPHYLWEDALQHTAYIRNRIPKRGASQTPHERLFADKPSLAGIPIFGQAVVVRTPEPIRRKYYRFDGRGNIGGFVGFSEAIRGYRVYVPGHGRPIKESTDVIVLDSMLVDEVLLDDEQASPTLRYSNSDADQADLSPTRSPNRVREAASRLQDTSWSSEQVEHVNGTSELTRRRRSERISARNIGPEFLCLVDVIREPMSMREARLSPQWKFWNAAIRQEIKALEDNATFTLVDPPPDAHVLDNTVQFRIKTGPAGEILQYKARVCARGDCQKFLLDYIETRAPVADLICVRIFLVLVVKFKMHMRQGDVPAAYLKAALKETVFVRQVKGFERPGQEHHVWKLNKALYGLKQAGREWNKEIDQFLKTYGLTPTTGDACLYYRIVADSLLLVCLYDDDVLVAHEDEAQVLRLMAALSLQYQVKDLGQPSQFLGMRIEHFEDTVLVSQAAYVQEILHRFAMLPCRTHPTPMIPHTRLDDLNEPPSADEATEMARMPYRQVVGSVLYLARVSRPDIAFTVNQLARHCSQPRKTAWQAAKYLLRYLSGTQSTKLRLAPTSSGIDVASDADFANDKADRKSVSGFVVYLFGAPVAWGSTKQGVVAQSSTAAEFIAANDGLLQGEWIKLLVDEILHNVRPPLTLTLQVDNVPTIHRIKREGSSGAQKAVDIRFHAIKDAWTNGNMAIEYIPTDINPADLLTKSLPHTQLRNKRGLCGLIE